MSDLSAGEAPPQTGRVYDLGSPGRIPVGEGRTFRIDGRDIAVFRARGGQLYATQAACPHRGGPLADGLVGDGSVICPLHAYRFDLASGGSRGNDCAALAVYRVAEAETGRLVLWLDENAAPNTSGE